MASWDNQFLCSNVLGKLGRMAHYSVVLLSLVIPPLYPLSNMCTG